MTNLTPKPALTLQTAAHSTRLLLARVECTRSPSVPVTAAVTVDDVYLHGYTVTGIEIVEVEEAAQTHGPQIITARDKQGRVYYRSTPQPQGVFGSVPMLGPYIRKTNGPHWHQFQPVELLVQDTMDTLEATYEESTTSVAMETILALVRVTMKNDHPAYELVEVPVVPGAIGVGIDGTGIAATKMELRYLGEG